MFSKAEKTRFVIVIAVIIILLFLYFAADMFRQKAISQVDSFEDCAAAGNPVMESYPRQCRTEDGRLFVEEVVDPTRLPDSNEDDEGEEVGDSTGLRGSFENIKRGECRRTGCSGQVCSDREVFTTCEYRPEYVCYDDAVCERQTDGECGWTQTSESMTCFDDIKIPPSSTSNSN